VANGSQQTMRSARFCSAVSAITETTLSPSIPTCQCSGLSSPS
jgi:hypothetical protein